MNNLISDMQKAVRFLENYPKISKSGDLSKTISALDKALTKFLANAEELELEQKPMYPEVSSLIEGEGKQLATVKFMKDFAKSQLGIKFSASRSDPKSRKKFLSAVARADKLEELKNCLDPAKIFRDLFDELIVLDIQKIEKKLTSMKPKELTGMLEANGISFTKTKAGMASKSKKALSQILSELEKFKLSEHF